VNGTYKIDPDAGSAQSNSGSGFYLGGAYNFDLTELGVGYLSFEPGLQWVYNHVDDNGYDFKEHFINVPLMFNYNYPIASDVTLIGYAGPTLSFGVSCKDDNDIDYYDDYLKQFDVKLGIGFAAVFMDHFKVDVGYNWGLVNRYDGDAADMHHKYVHLGVAYVF
jgi:hypothetical protein